MVVPIVVVAFNRVHSLERLLYSLNMADYPNNSIPLIISIDNNGKNRDVLEVANKFKWRHGTKKVKYQETNLGLRKHVLQCGAIARDYDGVIILEDDLYVSENFYHFARAGLSFSKAKEYIGGISLYNHQLNVHNSFAFSPLEDGYDNWYFQFASSWGQAWTNDQFDNFVTWYNNAPKIDKEKKIPSYVRSWSEKSWLKYFIAYLVEKDKYFLYPKISLTTNFGDSGTHMNEVDSAFQVPLYFGRKKTFEFSDLNSSLAVYDAFYESNILHRVLNLEKDQLIVDLYGEKDSFPEKGFLISKQILNYNIEKTFGRFLRPMEANIIENIQGRDFFYYDLSKKRENPFKQHKLKEMLFHLRKLSHRRSYEIFLAMSKNRIENKLKIKR